MNMQQAVKSVLGKYATFSGRASRSEFWWFILAFILASVVLAVIEYTVLAPLLGADASQAATMQPLRFIFSLALFLPSLAVAVRRLHDIDRSGWWYLICFVPVIGIFILLYWYIQPGTNGSNQFG